MRADPRRVLVLGAGTVGRWAARYLTAPGTVTTVDRSVGADLRADVLRPGPELLRAVEDAGLIVLALPEDVSLGTAGWLPVAAGPRTVLVSTNSVQRPLFDAVGPGPRLFGVNPMFSPTLESAGRPVALVSRTPDDTSALLAGRLRDGGMTVTELTPRAHDDAMSYLQALPHAVVLAYLGALARAPIDPATLLRLAPPPARTLFAVASRILSAPSEIYWDIQHANPAAADRRAQLRDALDDLDRTVAAGDAGGFRDLLAAAADRFGDRVEDGARDCRRLFELLTTVPDGPAVAPADLDAAI